MATFSGVGLRGALLLVFLGWVTVKIFKILRLAHEPRLSRIPGPWLARYTHLVLKFHVLQGQRTPYIHSLHERYGPYVRIAPNEVDVSDLAGFRAIHKIGTTFCKSPWYQQNTPKISSEAESSMFETMGNKRHARLRRINEPAFTPSETLTYEDTVREKVALAVSRLKKLASEGKADMLKIWTFMTFDIITELAFGQSFGQLEQSEASSTRCSRDFLLIVEKETELLEKIKHNLTIEGVNNELPVLWPMLKMLAPFSARVKEFATVFDRLHDDFGAIAVENTRKALENKTGNAKRTIFSRMLAAEADQSEDRTTEDVYHISGVAKFAVGFTVAGTDTSSVTLTYLVYAVLTHPAVKEKLLKEIQSCPGSVSFDELSKLTYLNNVMNEALRMWPAAPGSLYRMAPAAGYAFEEYEVPPRTRVNTQAWTFHYNASIFPNPKSFDPDRWLHPTPQMQEAFMAFGAGARICIGMRLAKMELLHGIFAFFKACPNAVAVSTEADMEPIDYFLIKPKALECLITLA